MVAKTQHIPKSKPKDTRQLEAQKKPIVSRTLLETFLFHDKLDEVDRGGCMILSSWRFLEVPCQNARGSLMCVCLC